MHWEVEPKHLIPYLPDGLELDLFEGKAYVGTIPFQMKNVRPRLLPPIPGISNFPEFNIRTYVTKDGKGGVLFLTLDAHSRVTCSYAPYAYGLPYRYAKCNFSKKDDYYTWSSKRESDGVVLRGEAKATGELMKAKPGSLEEFLFERYSLYVEYKGTLQIAHTQHDPWTFQEGEATLEKNSLTEKYNLGIEDVLKPDLVHLSDGVYVHTWPIELAERINPKDTRDYLFLDGDCGLCHRLATFIDKRIAKGKELGYRPILDKDAQRVISTLPQNIQNADSVYLIRNGKPYIRSSAGIRTLLYMRWYYRIWYPFVWLIPLPIRDIGYRFVAKYRHRIFSRPEICTFRVD
tara:strand:+ start:17443 stop:18483 length:1041 start_codon:yes stop_codon:yes gene_type:complete